MTAYELAEIFEQIGMEEKYFDVMTEAASILRQQAYHIEHLEKEYTKFVRAYGEAIKKIDELGGPYQMPKMGVEL